MFACRTTSTWRAIWAAGLLAATAAWGSAAPTVDLVIRGGDFAAEDAIRLELIVKEFQSCDDPQPPTVAGATLTYRDRSDEMSLFSDGRRTVQRRVRTFVYDLVPLAPGSLTIPPFRVMVDGTEYATDPDRLTVKPASDLFWVELTADRERIYVGQRVRLKLTMVVKPPRMNGQPLSPQLMLNNIRSASLGPFARRADIGSRDVPRPDGSTELYYTYTLDAEVQATRVGPLEVEGVEIGLDYPQRGTARQMRRRPRGELPQVLPVPTEGRPAGFSGAVGLFDISTTATPRSVRVGDPITLTIELFGDGMIDALPPPALTTNSGLVGGFKVSDTPLAGETVGTRRRYTTVIRALGPEVTEIPAIEYPYFDPDAQRFVIARSKPIPLEVEAGSLLSADQLTNIATDDPNAAIPRAEAVDGLRGNETNESVLTQTSRSVSLSRLAWLALTPLALVAGAAVAQAVHARAGARPSPAALLRAAHAAVGTAGRAGGAEQAAAVAAALTGYLAARAGLPAARLAGPAAVEFLRERGAPREVTDQVARLLDNCAERAYAGAETSADAGLQDEARACLAALEQVRL